MTFHTGPNAHRRAREHFQANPGAVLTPADVAQLLGCSRHHATKTMALLQREGIVERVEVYRVKQGRAGC